jgi:nucleoside-diphosphate-sugar epimerase
MRHSLITGGAGFIGSHLVEALLARGDRVTVVDDLSTGSISNLQGVRDHPQIRLVLDTVANEHRLTPLVDEADEVYHLAAVVGVQLVLREPERTASTNVDATEILLRRLAERPRPLFLASTSEVYGKNPKSPLTEDDDMVLGPPSKSRWVYACSKALDEYLALAWHQRTGLPVVIGRFFNVVGPRQIGRYGMVLPRFVDQALTGGPLVVYGDGQQVRCFAHVADVIQGILALMSSPKAAGQVFNLGNDTPVSIRDLAESVVRVVDPSLAIEHIPYEQAYPAGFEDIRCRVPDLTRIRQTVGYQPRYTLDDIVREVVDWKRGLLQIPDNGGQ